MGPGRQSLVASPQPRPEVFFRDQSGVLEYRRGSPTLPALPGLARPRKEGWLASILDPPLHFGSSNPWLQWRVRSFSGEVRPGLALGVAFLLLVQLGCRSSSG